MNRARRSSRATLRITDGLRYCSALKANPLRNARSRSLCRGDPRWRFCETASESADARFPAVVLRDERPVLDGTADFDGIVANVFDRCLDLPRRFLEDVPAGAAPDGMIGRAAAGIE